MKSTPIPFLNTKILLLVHDSTVVTIRGLKATEEGKPASVKVSFKVKKTGKTSKYSYVSKVNVIEDKQTITAVQSKVRAITVTSNKSMEGQAIKVTKGTTDVKFTSELSADGKSAILTFASDLAAADYTVTVGDLTATVKGELSKVDKIEITSDVIAMDGKIGTSKKGFAGYVVTNQFEENITKKVSLNVNTSASGATASDGTITVNFGAAPNLNDVISVVLIYQSGTSNVVSTSKTLKVSTESMPYTVEKYGIYNADKKTLTATNALSDDFYYLFRVKDQYNNYMSANSIISAINPAGGAKPTMWVNSTFALTGLEFNTTPKKVTVDGTDYVGLLIQQEGSKKTAPGTATVMLIPGGSGVTETDTITVGSGSTVTSLVVTPPASIASGSNDNYLDFKALDADGNEVTDYNTLTKITISNDKFSFVKKDGTTKLLLNDAQDGATTPGSVVSAVFTLQNYQTVVVTVKVEEGKILSGIVALDANQATAAVSGKAVSIPVSKFTGEDQYGSTKSADKFSQLGTTGSAMTAGELYLMVIPDDANNTVFNEGTISGVYDAENNNVTKEAIFLGKNDTFTVTGTAIGTESYTVRVVEAVTATKAKDYKTKVSLVDKNITASSSFTFTLTSTQASKYKSFEVSGPDTIYADFLNTTGAAWETQASQFRPEVKVYGIVAGGAKVQLDAAAGEYKINAGANVAVDGTTKLMANVAKDKLTVNNDTVEGSYTVVINQNGEEITKKVTINKAAVKVASLEYANGAIGYNVTGVTAGSIVTVTGSTILAQLKGKDTYGFDVKATGGSLEFVNGSAVDSTLTMVVKDFNRVTGSTGSITSNGNTANNASVSGTAGDSCTVEFKVGDKVIFTTTVSWTK